jgi:3-oxoacyl-[acyl-carrier protein] reductase
MGKTLLSIGGSSTLSMAYLRAHHSNYDRVLLQVHSGGDLNFDPELQEKVEILKANLGAKEEVESFCEILSEKKCIPDDILHFAAPPMKISPFKKESIEDFYLHFEVQFFSSVRILQNLLPLMAKRKSGRVIFVLSSVVLGEPPKGLCSYTSAKYALNGMMKCLASEYGGKGIRINAISPSMTETRYLDSLPESVLEGEIKDHPLGRLAQVEDIVPVLNLLLEGFGDYFNGVNIPITGRVV